MYSIIARQARPRGMRPHPAYVLAFAALSCGVLPAAGVDARARVVAPRILASISFAAHAAVVRRAAGTSLAGVAGTRLYTGDSITTGSRQVVTLGLANGCFLRLAGSTSVSMGGTHSVRLTSGEVDAIVIPGNTWRLQTTDGTTSSFSGEFDVHRSTSGTTVTAVRGVATVSNGHGTVAVHPNQDTTLTAAQPAPAPTVADAMVQTAWLSGVPAPTHFGDNVALDSNGGHVISISPGTAPAPGGAVDSSAALIDGDTTTSWRSSSPSGAGQSIVLAFSDQRVFFLSAVYLDPLGPGVPRAAAVKAFSLRVSTTGVAAADFRTVASGQTVRKDQLQRFALPAGTRSRYLQLVINSTWGSGAGASIAEIAVASDVNGVDTRASSFREPIDVATDADGNVYVADSSANRIDKLSPSGQFLLSFGSKGKRPGQLSNPNGIAVDAAGNVYVTDTDNQRISEFSSTGAFVRTIGSGGTGAGQLYVPGGVAVDAAGNVYVANTHNLRIEKYAPSGALLASWGNSTRDCAPFCYAERIAVASDGKVYVSDIGAHTVFQLSPTGKVLARIGSYGSGPGQLDWPFGIALDGQGHLYVVDQKNDRVVEFTTSGQYVTEFGTKGSAAGRLNSPYGVALDHAGDVVVADYGNTRLQIFGPGATPTAIWR